ncbi:MAG: NAD-dependent epimerase/dehydratase family protein [Bacteroidota bacterium]|nr:NAD-dependent epimerase/dehydratase family protein [Bacteroidota bacterium]
MMSRILIIGSEGQLGSELSTFLKKEKNIDDIILSDIKDNSSSDLTYKKLNALNFKKLESLVEDYKIDEIYHLAAILSAKGEQDPMLTWNLNMNSLFNVLDLAKNKTIKKVFWPSSISVFGKNTPKINTNQFSIKEPNTVYGISKLSGERWCEYYNIKYGTDIRSVRFPGIISSNTLPGGGTTDYAVDIFYSFLKDEKYKCFLNQDTMLPMIYIDDAIESIFKIMGVNKNSLNIRSSYNLAGFSMTPKMIEIELKKIKEKFIVEYNPDYRQEIADSWPESIDDISAQNDWGWYPKYDLNKTINEMIRRLENIKK